MKKFFITLLCFVLATSLFVLPVGAVSESGFIYNGDNDFTPEQIEALKSKAESIYLKYGVEAYFAKDFSYTSSSQLGIFVLENSGEPGKGIIFANTELQYSLDAYGGLQDIFTHDVTELIYETCCKKENYYEKAVAYYDSVEQYLVMVDYPTLQPDASSEPTPLRLVDYAGLLSETEFQNLLWKLDSTSENIGMDFVIITNDSIYSENGQSYCQELYSSMGYGTGETKSGIMIAYSPENLCCVIYTKGLGSNALSDSHKKALVDTFNSDTLQHGCETAFLNCITQCEKLITDTVTDNQTDTKESAPVKTILICVIPTVLIGGIVAVIVSAHKKKKSKA